jgi:hypothetical protein
MQPNQPAYDPAAAARRELGHWENQRSQSHHEYIGVINQRGNEISALKDSVGARSQRAKEADRLLLDAEKQIIGIRATVNRPINRHEWATLWVVLFAVALALLEAPANKYLFDVALSSSGIVSILVSVFVAFIVLILAHYAGRCLRQVWSEYRHRVVWSYLFTFGLLMAAFFVIVSIITIARAKTSVDASLSGFRDILSAVSSDVGEIGFWRSLTAAFGDISALVLAIVNVGGIVVTMVISYFNYDPDKDYDAAKNELDRRRAEVGRLQRRFSEQQTVIIKKFAPDLAGPSSNHKIANGHVIELKRQLAIPLEPIDLEAIDLEDTMAEDADQREFGGYAEPETPPAGPPSAQGHPPTLTPIQGGAGLTPREGGQSAQSR